MGTKHKFGTNRLARILISFFILFFFSSLALAANPDLPPFSILIQNDSNAVKSSDRLVRLYKGDKINGQFTADFQNLGILGIRFYNFKKINSDSVIFRIKEHGSSSWYYQNSYKVDQFQPNDYFTFGFPLIVQSKGKTFDFQIESVKGAKYDAIAVHKTNPVLQARYQFPLLSLFKNPSDLANFLYLKFVNIYFNPSTVMYTFIYLLPFAIFLISLTRITRRTRVILWMMLFSLLFIAETFFLDSKIRDLRYAILSGYWIFILFDQKLESRFTFLLIIILFPFMVLLKIIHNSFYAEQIAIWIYYLLIIGAIEMLVENMLKLKKLTKINTLSQTFR